MIISINQSRMAQRFNITTAALTAAALIPAVSGLAGISQPPKKTFGGGGGVGRLVLDDFAGKEGAWDCHYDMVLVERIQGKPKADSGLYIPDDDLPRLHLCRVMSVGKGREEENGMVAPMLTELKPGDVVIAKNPWGIGPKDEELEDGRKLSFMRYQDIAALITGGLASEDE